MYKYNTNFNELNNLNSSNFKSMTTTSNNNLNNFNQAYQNNSPLIQKVDFSNNNNLIHNNINKDNILLEQTIEYNINIDSEDRSLVAFPNPFNFTVTFGGHGKVTEKKQFVKKNYDLSNTINESKYYNKKIEYEATPGPVIDRKFKNVKNLRIDYLILPKTNIINIDISGNTCNLSTLDSDKLTYKYKYLLLRINEIVSDKILGTNKKINGDVFILYPDKIMGNDHIMWLPTSGVRNYKNSNLDNLNRLTFELLTPKGELLYLYDSSNNNIIDINNVSSDISDCINSNFQISYSIVLGIIENEINTNINY